MIKKLRRKNMSLRSIQSFACACSGVTCTCLACSCSCVAYCNGSFEVSSNQQMGISSGIYSHGYESGKMSSINTVSNIISSIG